MKIRKKHLHKSGSSFVTVDMREAVQVHVSSREERLVLILLVFLILASVLGALQRYVFSRNGLSFLIYVPKGVAGIYVLWWFGRRFLSEQWGGFEIGLAAVFAISSATGLVTSGKLLQVAFGLWSWIPLLLGFVVAPVLWKTRRSFNWCLALWILVLTGILLDVYVDFPWSGKSYNIWDMTLRVGRSRMMQGIHRHTGFAQNSALAAYQLILFGLVLLGSDLKRTVRLTIWGVSGVGVLLTTNKTAFLTFFLLSMVHILYLSARKRAVLRSIFQWLPSLFMVAGVWLPFSTLFIDYAAHLGHFRSFLGRSLMIRMSETWPAALHAIMEKGSLLLGRGMGGVGAAQYHFGRQAYVLSDNLYVALYACFGIGMFLIVFIFVKAMWKLRPFDDRWQYIAYCMGLTVLMKGITGIVLESTLLMVGSGVILGMAYQLVDHKPVVLFRKRDDQLTE